ncbi:hypothetical protein ACJJIC_12015 [Microbulbifer sp. ANSA002]|uniref:hypothetical protein n=1 Tax=unclassified Microbulbifer TaxID=2619833 RepID=UPI004042A759
MCSKEKLAGWALSIYAFLSLIIYIFGFVVFYFFFFSEFPELLSWAFIVLLVLLMSINSIGLAAGIKLIQEDRGAYKIAIPYSIFCLLNFPVGTVVGFFCLWVYYEKDG